MIKKFVFRKSILVLDDVAARCPFKILACDAHALAGFLKCIK
jgi:hypothetical protein